MPNTKEDVNVVDTPEKTVHNFLEEGKWHQLMAGYADLEKYSLKYFLYWVYRVYILSFLACNTGAGWEGAYLSYESSKVDTIQALHMTGLAQVCFFGLLSKLVSGRHVRETMASLSRGVFVYTEEGEDEEASSIKSSAVTKIRFLNKSFNRFILLISVTNAVWVPLFKLFFIKEDTSRRVINPYLPFPLYLPFSTRTVLGYAAGYLVNILLCAKIALMAICMDNIYVSCTLQLTAQFRVLNHSLRNIEKRALKMMAHKKEANSEVTRSTYFHDCLYRCLRANIMHHQALLRLKRTMERYSGLIFFIVVCYASLVLASNILSILENPPAYQQVNFVVTGLCEILYTFHYCWYGEEVTEESSKLYLELYDTPWYKYDQRFGKLLSITLCNTRVPTEMKTAAFGISASLHTFNSIMTNMYQIMNIVRNK